MSETMDDTEYIMKTRNTGGPPKAVHIRDDTEPNGIKCNCIDADRNVYRLTEAERQRRGLDVCLYCTGERPGQTSQDWSAYRLAVEQGKKND